MDVINNKFIPVMQDAYRDSPSLGVYLLTAQLRRKGYSCEVFDWVANPHISFEEVIKKLLKYKVVFFSANSLNWAIIRILAQHLKKNNPRIKTCVGGPHATYYPNSVLAGKCFDSLFRGDADRYIHLIYEIVGLGKNHSIPGFFYKETKGSVNRVQVNTEEDIEQCNWRPAYDLIPTSQYCTMPVLTSRGCKYHCTFCSVTGKRNWRSYSAETTVEQLIFALPYCQKTRTKIINIVDNSFTTNHHRIIDICKALPEKTFRRRLTYDSTIEDLQNPELIEALEPFTSDLLVGAEVVNKTEAKKIHKPVSPELITGAAQNLQRFNMSERAVFSFIIGFPWHTREYCLDALNFITNLILDYGVRVYLQWYWAIPGSVIWKNLEKEHKVNIKMVDIPGFFRNSDWFYQVRQMNSEDAAIVDERIRPVQMLLTLGHGSQERRPFEYSPPLIEARE